MRRLLIDTLAVVSVLISIAVPVWFFFLQQDTPSLTLRLRSNTQIALPSEVPSEKITILLNGEPAEEIWFEVDPEMRTGG